MSLAKNTHRNYSQGIKVFERFCLESQIQSPWPPTTDTITAFVASMSLKGYSHSTINGYISSISYKCKLNGIVDNTKQFVVKSLLEGVRRTRRPLEKRHPITLLHLNTLIKALPRVCRSQYETALFSAAFAIAHLALLRISEFTVTNKKSTKSVLSLENIMLGEDNVRLYLASSKTDQKCIGSHVDIKVNSQNRFCYNVIKSYLSYRPSVSGPLFCHFDSCPLTSYQFNAVLRKALNLTGMKNCYFKSHSFRIGGATHMFHQGHKVEDIKRIGRWRSNAYKLYIRS